MVCADQLSGHNYQVLQMHFHDLRLSNILKALLSTGTTNALPGKDYQVLQRHFQERIVKHYKALLVQNYEEV